MEFKVGDHVYLQVSPMKGVCHFGIKGKLAPRYIGPYPIIDKYGPASYQVEVAVKLSGVHNVFHVSQLKTCLKRNKTIRFYKIQWNDHSEDEATWEHEEFL
jgi:hypothetical protein